MNYLEAELESKIQSDPEIWRFIREGSLDGLWYWDLENPEHEYMSPEFWRLFGFDPATKEHLAAEWQDIIFPEDLEVAKDNIAKHMADPSHPYDQIVRYHHADGHVVWVRCRGLAIRDKSGKAVRLLGAHTDVTALQEERRRTLSARNELEAIFNAVTSGIIAFDANGQVARCNNLGRHILGGISDPTPFDWPASIKFLDAVDLRPIETGADPVHRVRQGEILKAETQLMQRAGSKEDPRYVRVASAPVSDHKSGLKTVMIIDDVSSEERNRQAVERKGRLDALGQLTGGIAHDFNNILTSLLYSIVIASRTDDPKRRQENLKEAEDSIELAKNLTSRLMAFARRQPGLSASRSVNEIFDGFLRLVRPLMEETLTIEFDIREPGLIVFCELAQLESALMNLVLNSRDAILRSGKGSKIILSARAVEDSASAQNEANRFVEISVMDDGPGMDGETTARATDPFFTTKEQSAGSGLGLATVYAFAGQASGEMRIYSELGVGTTVQLRLPRGTAQGGREVPMPANEIKNGNGETILLVEDEFHILSATSKLLTDIGYKIVTAMSGKEALALMSDRDDIDIMVTDVVMPGEIGGFELAARIRDLRSTLPIIYVSGYTGFTASDMGDVKAPLLQKPASPAELSMAIHTGLQSRG